MTLMVNSGSALHCHGSADKRLWITGMGDIAL